MSHSLAPNHASALRLAEVLSALCPTFPQAAVASDVVHTPWEWWLCQGKTDPQHGLNGWHLLGGLLPTLRERASLESAADVVHFLASSDAIALQVAARWVLYGMHWAEFSPSN